MEHCGSLVWWQTCKLELFKRIRGQRRDLRPMFDIKRGSAQPLAKLAVGWVMLELQREQLQGQLFKYLCGRWSGFTCVNSTWPARRLFDEETEALRKCLDIVLRTHAVLYFARLVFRYSLECLCTREARWSQDFPVLSLYAVCRGWHNSRRLCENITGSFQPWCRSAEILVRSHCVTLYGRNIFS